MKKRVASRRGVAGTAAKQRRVEVGPKPSIVPRLVFKLPTWHK